MKRVFVIKRNDLCELDSQSEISATRESSSEKKIGFSVMKTMGFFVVFLMIFSVLFSVTVVLRDPPSDAVLDPLASRFLQLEPNKVIGSVDQQQSETLSEEVTADKLLSGLLSDGFDESTCLSRYQLASYRKGPHRNPDPRLVSRLRSYEELHRLCGPHTEPYSRAVERLRSSGGPGSGNKSDCNYLVWISFSGLGNRILTLGSAFLYALLTDRVLLIDPGVDMIDLFCEPFPGASWFLPQDFPLRDRLSGFDLKTPERYGQILKDNRTGSNSDFVYLHLAHDYDFHDKLFFCDQEQTSLTNTPWLIMKTDNYFAPSLFLMPLFERELNDLFPNKELVFHFLGRYLLHPTNKVWGLITRYFRTYLANADERIGIQIRVFDVGSGPFQHVLDQILECTVKENILLPEIGDREDSVIALSKSPRSKAVLITSLSSGYFEKMRDMYWESPSSMGDLVGFYQPSHEEYQQTEKRTHNRKALAEMFLLSLTDVLVTSSWSTFGYVAQSLGGLRPWILVKSENRTVPEPACRRAVSMEPCFHAPPLYDCKAKEGADTGKMVPHVKHCEDMSWGLKLVDSRDEL